MLNHGEDLLAGAGKFSCIVVTIFSLLMTACGGYPASHQETSPQLTSLTVTSGSSNIVLGQTAQFQATGKFSDGSSKDLSDSVLWGASPSGVLSVNNFGLATGMAVGTATVTAQSGSVTGSGKLAVSAATQTTAPVALVSIAVRANTANAPLGTTAQFTATGSYSDGTSKDITSAVAWSSSPSGIMTISTSGVATGTAMGVATVSAQLSSVTGTGTLTVSAARLLSLTVNAALQVMPLGTQQQLTATGLFTNGTQDVTSTSNWAATSGAVTIGTGGVAVASQTGNTFVSATYNGVSASAQLAVSPAALTSISISPAAPAIPLSSSQQLAVIGTYTDGSTQDITQSATWNVDTPAIASISATGVAYPQQDGSTGIEATSGGIVGSATLTVVPVAAVGYFTLAGGADASIRISNTGATGGNLCAMAYIFDQDQQMVECCGCTISPDGLRTFSLARDFTSNPLIGVPPVTGTVMMVPADYSSNPTCNAASITPSGLAVGWSTHLLGASADQPTTTEEPLSFTALSSTLSSSLQAQCSFVQQLGSGQGICTCGSGD